ncbi:MAG: glycosyltransferase family 9 protein [Ignavibacteriaceae bacterium]
MKGPRFLIARIDRIGDVVLSTPLPREIKKKYPDSFITILVKNYTKDIYDNNPYVDSIITFDNDNLIEKKFWDLVKEIKALRFNYALMLLPNKKLNYVLFFAGITYRIGVGHRLFQFLTFTKYVNRKKYKLLRHEADYCLDMVRKIGINVTDITPEIFLSEDEKGRALVIRKNLIGNYKKLIGINISSGNSAPNLKTEEYKKLVLLLLVQNKYKILIMDKDVPGIIDNIPNIDYPNRNNDLRSSIINLSTLDLLISNSTGPMHIVASLGIPTLSLFCPLTACSPKLWGPLGNKSEIVLPSKKYCDTQCPINPKKCDYSKEGGLTAEYLLDRFNNFIKTLEW